MLLLIRGLPGSGKSTEANRLISCDAYDVLYEADMFFGPAYRFDPKQLRDAHAWCLEETKHALALGLRVIVANTFTRKWEMACYRSFCEKRSIPYSILTMTGNWGSLHDVPTDAFLKMAERWEGV